MADGVYDAFKRILDTTVEVSTADIKVMLLDNTYTFNATHSLATVQLDEVSGTNYTAGGKGATSTGAIGGATEWGKTWGVIGSGWTNVTLTNIRYAVYYYDGATDYPLVCVDFGQDYSPTAADFNVTPASYTININQDRTGVDNWWFPTAIGTHQGDNQTVDLTNDTIKCALMTSSYATNIPDPVYATTHEITGTNYTAGGDTISVSVAAGSGQLVLSSNPSWTNVTFTNAAKAIYYSDTDTNKRVFMVTEFDTAQSITAGTFTIEYTTALRLGNLVPL